MVEEGLKQDVVKLMGALFGKDTGQIFENYYDENDPKEMLVAASEMLTKLLGKQTAHRYCTELVNKHAEIQKFAEIDKIKKAI